MSEGIKYDKDKRRLAEMLIDFAPEIEELCKVWEFGANKYSKSNWKLVDGGYDRYSNALIRHLIAERNGYMDDESKLYHAAHIAFNALARLHFILNGKCPVIGIKKSDKSIHIPLNYDIEPFGA